MGLCECVCVCVCVCSVAWVVGVVDGAALRWVLTGGREYTGVKVNNVPRTLSLRAPAPPPPRIQCWISLKLSAQVARINRSFPAASPKTKKTTLNWGVRGVEVENQTKQKRNVYFQYTGTRKGVNPPSLFTRLLRTTSGRQHDTTRHDDGLRRRQRKDNHDDDNDDSNDNNDNDERRKTTTTNLSIHK